MQKSKDIIRYYFNEEKFKLIKGDTFKILKKFEDKTIDTIFAHPPYANIIKYSKDIKEDLSRLELNEFLNQMKLFSKECFRILKKNKYWQF